MKTSDFDYYLPAELIAQTPVEPRDHSRLMVLDRSDGSIKHNRFYNLPEYLRDGDILVFNDSRVIPARLAGRKIDSGGKVEILLLRKIDSGIWEALIKPGKRVNTGSVIEILKGPAAGNGPGTGTTGEISGIKQDGVKEIRFSDEALLPQLGRIPLPPYIRTPLSCPERYQTIYSRIDGSVAAPTAGLHFTPELLETIKKKGVECRFVTLHVSLDTFRPVREEDPLRHIIYKEYGILSEEQASQLSRAKSEGRRIICTGTTTVRLVEQASQVSSPYNLQPFAGWASLFILPGHRFRLVDALITNFHLPRSTLLMLVSALGGRELIMRAYQEAIASGYRFYSFGDAMLVL